MKEILKNDAGPEHAAPVNPHFASSFDEYAGVFIADEPVLLGERDGPAYDQTKAASDFGREMASSKRFADREWAEAEAELKAEWLKKDGADWDTSWPEIQSGWTAARGMG